MSFYKRNSKEIQVILFLTILKLSIHLASNSRFGFHRDELLYMAMADHLSWGYKEVPPFIAGVSWFSNTFLGDSVFAMRLIPTLASTLIISITGLTVLLMKGGKFAIFVACSAMIVSPAFLASGYLLQPVVFDQLFWVISAYLTFKYIQTQKTNYVYFLGATVGIGMLNKYTMAFFILALITALLVSPHRKLLFNRSWGIAFLIAFLIFLPNLIWQITHNLPVISHMKELRNKQLAFINSPDFILQLLIVHASATIVWLSGFFYLFISKSNNKYAFAGISFILMILILLVLNGKVYYSFGAFPILFAAGGVCFQKVMGSIKSPYKYSAASLILIPSLFLIPIVVPILSFGSTLRFFEITSRSGLKFPLKWEDQIEHATTQDYGDMLGWEEIARYTQIAYQSIPVDQRAQTTIVAGNYGQAGAIQYFRAKYNLPEPVCLNSSFALWAPESIATHHLIVIDDYDNKITEAYEMVKEVGIVENSHAREKGTKIYLLSNPLVDINSIYRRERIKALK